VTLRRPRTSRPADCSSPTVASPTLRPARMRTFAAACPAGAAEFWDYNAGWADKISGEVIATWPGAGFDYATSEPYGVVALRKIETSVDVTAAVDAGERFQMAATIWLPHEWKSPAVICFAWPGGGYSREYFSFDMPGSVGGGQAGWHARRGWIFVSFDTLNSGASTRLSRLLLGVSRHHTKMSSAPGTVLAEPSYLPRRTNIGGLAPETYNRAAPEVASNGRGWPFCAWCFHYDDEPHEIIEVDMLGYPARQHTPVWASDSIPPCVLTMMSPGAIAPEAASVTVRVFIGVGERDTVPKLRTEPTAYPRSPDITTFECPEMAHMHNFASTRERMWTRVQ
jgi:hypothetical protein